MTARAEITDECRQYLEYLEKFAKPLIQSGIYASTEEFLRDCVKDFAQRKVKENQQVALGFEKQYISWEKFNDALMNVATPEQEDAAMEWEWARDSAKSWQKLVDKLS
jgi:Arc/MetJ-type ribon-helix-helix transcriptional regulator